ncbi:hypothetical protein D3C76_829090 [compost metagenome]
MTVLVAQVHLEVARIGFGGAFPDRTEAVDLPSVGVLHAEVDPHLAPLREAGRQLVPGADVGHLDRHRRVAPGHHGCRQRLEGDRPGARQHLACPLRILMLAEVAEEGSVGAGEPVRGDLLAIRAHDRRLTGVARHMAVLAGLAFEAIGTFQPFVVGAFDRHAAEGMGDVVAGRAEIRACVQCRIHGVVIGRYGILAWAELGRLAMGSWAQDVGTVVQPCARADVVASLAVHARHRVILRAVLNRGAIDCRVDLPGGQADGRMAAGAEVVDLAASGLAGMLEQGAIDRLVPGLRHHRAAPLPVDLGMAGTADFGIVKVLHLQHGIAGGVGPVREEWQAVLHLHQPRARRLQPFVIALAAGVRGSAGGGQCGGRRRSQGEDGEHHYGESRAKHAEAAADGCVRWECLSRFRGIAHLVVSRRIHGGAMSDKTIGTALSAFAREDANRPGTSRLPPRPTAANYPAA